MRICLIVLACYGLEEIFSDKWKDDLEAVVIFYADWWYFLYSFYSSNALIELEKSLIGFDIPSYKIEATEKAEKYGIKGFPQIFYARKGDLIKYEGVKTEPMLAEWLKKRVRPEIKFLVEEKTQLRKQAELCVQYETCMISKGLPPDLLLEVSRRVDLTILSFEGEAELTLYTNYGENKFLYESEYELDPIIDFTKASTKPALIPLERKYLDELFNKGGKAVVFVRDKRHKSYDYEIISIGNSLKDKLSLLIADVSNQLGKQIQQVLKIPDKLLPCVRIIECGGGSLNINQYSMFDDISTANILKFYDSWEKKLIKPYILSQELPKKTIENRVHVIVYQNFNATVHDTDKNVLVLFYTPWCTYSKAALPVIEQLAFELRAIQNFLIGKIDCHHNQVYENIRGFPTIRLYLYNEDLRAAKDYVQYEGERTVELIKKFVMKNIKPQYNLDL